MKKVSFITVMSLLALAELILVGKSVYDRGYESGRQSVEFKYFFRYTTGFIDINHGLEYILPYDHKLKEIKDGVTCEMLVDTLKVQLNSKIR